MPNSFFRGILRNPFYSFRKGVESIKRLVSSRLPYRVQQFLNENGDKHIESITIYRQPIMSVLKRLLTILTLGKSDRVLDKLGYDDLFHLYMVVQFADDSKALIEKNQDINITDDIQSKGSGGESISVDMKGRQPTLNELLDNTRKGMGARFYPYNFRSNNCQDWVLSVLKYNGLDSPMTTTFIKQNVDELAKTLPPDVSIMVTGATKVASYVNRALQSLGFKGFEEGGMVV